MITTFITSGANTVISVGQGIAVKILGIRVEVSGANDGAQVNVDFKNDTSPFFTIVSGPLNTLSSVVQFGVGLTDTGSVEQVVTPVSGVVVLNTNQQGQLGPLPDVWWPWDFTVAVSTGFASVDSVTVVYERRMPRSAA